MWFEYTRMSRAQNPLDAEKPLDRWFEGLDRRATLSSAYVEARHRLANHAPGAQPLVVPLPNPFGIHRPRIPRGSLENRDISLSSPDGMTCCSAAKAHLEGLDKVTRTGPASKWVLAGSLYLCEARSFFPRLLGSLRRGAERDQPRTTMDSGDELSLIVLGGFLPISLGYSSPAPDLGSE